MDRSSFWWGDIARVARKAIDAHRQGQWSRAPLRLRRPAIPRKAERQRIPAAPLGDAPRRPSARSDSFEWRIERAARRDRRSRARATASSRPIRRTLSWNRSMRRQLGAFGSGTSSNRIQDLRRISEGSQSAATCPGSSLARRLLRHPCPGGVAGKDAVAFSKKKEELRKADKSRRISDSMSNNSQCRRQEPSTFATGSGRQRIQSR